MGAETSRALLLGRQHSCCLHTLPNPALHPCFPAQDCLPGQGLVSLGISLTEPCFRLVQEQETDCFFSWDEKPRYKVKAEPCQPGSICNAQGLQNSTQVFALHSLTVRPSLCIPYYAYLLSSLLCRMSRKERERFFTCL